MFPRATTSSENKGRSFDAMHQHLVISSHSSSGHSPLNLRGNVPPAQTCAMISLTEVKKKKGMSPDASISQNVTPQAQTSLYCENLPFFNASGDI
mmetsp:Transcript_45641/g.66891  ORF Transcript_45641/g.66891 Transcript_45641/m.66891 type:complete len:95 (-) Transcript_45641:491-775(-)